MSNHIVHQKTPIG